MNSNAPLSVTNTYALVNGAGATIASVTSVADVTPTPEPGEVLPVAAIGLLLGLTAWRRHRTRSAGRAA